MKKILELVLIITIIFSLITQSIQIYAFAMKMIAQ